MVTRAEQSNEESTQDSEENFTEADSMAAEVGEDDIEEEEEEACGEADDEGILQHSFIFMSKLWIGKQEKRQTYKLNKDCTMWEYINVLKYCVSCRA